MARRVPDWALRGQLASSGEHRWRRSAFWARRRQLTTPWRHICLTAPLARCRSRHGPPAGAFCSDAAIPVVRAVRASAMTRTLCILLWARPGAEDGLIAYENRVMDIAAEHGCHVLQRARSSGASGQPLEMQLLEFPSVQALDEFMTDGRRESLACERDRVIARTEVIEVQVVQ